MNHLFLDCDGVLADFDKTATDLLGMAPRHYEDIYGEKAFWNRIYEADDFFFNLDPMSDAHELYESVKHLSPTILTGIPRGEKWANQKLRWRDKHFPGVEMICCKSKEKFVHMKHKGDVLIDDWTKYQHIWEDEGGIFIQHFSAEQSIEALRAVRPIWFSEATV